MTKEEFEELQEKSIGFGAKFEIQERGGHRYAYYNGEYVFRVSRGREEELEDLLRMAYNSGWQKALRAVFAKQPPDAD